MREALFVKQNSARWQAFESMQNHTPDELAECYITITDDLAYAKTFYPDSKTTVYLNGLASRFHQRIYKNKTEKGNRFITYWQRELPLLFYQYRRQLLYAFTFFIIACFIGALSAQQDVNFVRLIMGDDYVNMTEHNIAAGKPFGVYDSEGEFSMFIFIFTNNARVAIATFAMGVLLSGGTVYMLFYNGIMLGSFQYFFFSKGLGMASVLVIWLHGVIEISSIIIAGAAGLIIGNSLLFPKTYTRLASVKNGARVGLKMALGVVPLLFVAALIESFVTRHANMPVWLSGGLITGSLVFIIWYVIVYPIMLHQKTNIV
jgi:uncharacterized membrane protein SpoIIM required for sporulation